MPVRAVIFDVGGVIVTSPFDAFARYEADNGLPAGFLRQVNATDPHANAWARLERNEVDLDEFAELFEAEAWAAGHEIDGRAVLALLGGELRPAMVEALRRCHDRLATALLTNNFVSAPAEVDADERSGSARGPMASVLGHVDVVVESSRVGLRKPDPAIYRLVCDELGVEPHETVFLDDLGVNLKPARAIGMTTIKVTDPDDALTELASVVGFALG